MAALIEPASNAQRYLFVVGLMRSGTTLLYRLLNNHPQICLMYEADLFALRPLLWPSWRAGVWCQRLEFWNTALTRHGIDADATRAFPSRISGPREAVEVLGRAYARGRPSTYLGSKSIHHCQHLPEIARAFPAARFVVLWRPIAEIIDSLRRAGETNAYLAPTRRRRQLFQQYGRLAEGVLILRRLGSPVHELVYRDLFSNPETVCRALCDFLELPWSPKMLESDPDKLGAIPNQAHHFHALHTPVGAIPACPAQLPANVVAKIRMYEDYWATKYARQLVRLAPRSTLPFASARRLFVFERWMDRFRYRIHRGVIFAKLLVYRFAPLSWLRFYRHHRRRKI